MVRKRLDLTVENTAQRIGHQLTGADLPQINQLITLSGSARNPRQGWTVSLIFWAFAVHQVRELKPTQQTQWVDPLQTDLPLAFDHRHLLVQCVSAAREQVRRFEFPPHAMATDFTMLELRHWAEAVLGESVDASYFRRRVESAAIVRVAGEGPRRGLPQRPARLFRFPDSVNAC